METKIVPWYNMTYDQVKQNGLLQEVIEWVTIKLHPDKREDYIKYLCGMCGFPIGFDQGVM
jgi:hypothetical protein